MNEVALKFIFKEYIIRGDWKIPEQGSIMVKEERDNVFWERTSMYRACGERGATLIEVLIVVILVGFGVVALAGLFARNLFTLQMNREYLTCSSLVTDIVERIRSLPFDGEATKNIPGLALYLSSDPSHQYRLSRFYEYLEVSTDEIPALRTLPEVLNDSLVQLTPQASGNYILELRLRWKESMSPVRIVTYIAQGGINDLVYAQ